ncbi:MAG: ribonuclease P protein component [Thermodesulfobacteriota bacterium]
MEKVVHFSDQSFSKRLRIIKSENFKQIFKTGKKIHSENFILYLIQNNLAIPRIGISISKKTSPKSTERNRIKRLIRETFRTSKFLFDNNDIVIVVKNNISNKKADAVFLELKGLLSKKN